MTGFYEDDEPVEDVLAAFETATERGVTHQPVAYRCQHFEVSSSDLAGVPVAGCGCDMRASTTTA